MHVKHLPIVLSAIVVLFLAVVTLVVFKTRTGSRATIQGMIPITPIPLDSSRLPESLLNIQDKARIARNTDLQYVSAPISTRPGDARQVTPVSATSSATPGKNTPAPVQ
ncbi:MAG: hypothetical protein WCO78_01815 [Candidatus Roizmanbacteria bacterium]